MKINKIFLFISLFIIFSIFLFSQASSIVINEILPNPEEYSDAEWLELYSNETINLSGFRLDTTGQTYNFTNATIDDFLIITKNKTAFLLLWQNVSQSKIIEWTGMGLNNAGESVSLLNVSTLIDNTTYPSFSSKQGKSWGRMNNGTFIVCNLPTPGATNNCSQQNNQTNQTNQSLQNESTIKITDSPNDAKFGESIEVELSMYRGNTAKYAVYIYVEDENGVDVSDKVTLHLDDKYTNYTETVELELKCKNEHGTYKIVAEGLGEKDTEDIEIDICKDYENQKTSDNQTQTENGGANEGTTIGDFTYSLTIPNTIYLNQDFQVKVKITNNGQEPKSFNVWSYVYNGPKCYSCVNDDREENKESITVESGNSEEIELQDIVDEAEPSTYKLKIKVLQQDLKTPKEFTYNITLEGNNNQPATTNTKSGQQAQQQTQQYNYPVTGMTVESESLSLVKIAPYIFASLCLLLLIYLIIKKI